MIEDIILTISRELNTNNWWVLGSYRLILINVHNDVTVNSLEGTARNSKVATFYATQ